MTKTIIILLAVFMPIMGIHAQSWRKDSLCIRHWNIQPDCSVYFFKNQFVGVLLDGVKLLERDPFLDNWIKSTFCLDVNHSSFIIDPDTSAVYKFEKALKIDLIKKDTIKMSVPYHITDSFYLRQYLPLSVTNKNYLLVSFQLDKENYKIGNSYYYFNGRNNIETKTYDYFLLVATKRFIGLPLHSHESMNDPFYILYNIDTEYINYYFFGTK